MGIDTGGGGFSGSSGASGDDGGHFGDMIYSGSSSGGNSQLLTIGLLFLVAIFAIKGK